jgi:uncharacterized protein (DUF2336 family)
LEEEGQWEDHEIDGEKVIHRNAANLLRIRNWKAAAGDKESRKKAAVAVARSTTEEEYATHFTETHTLKDC